MLWHLLRMSRWEPPGLADNGRRAVLYRAAIQQVEELQSAAEAVGPASSRLPLYYALNQAGRAVLSARQPRDEIVFATKEDHGLAVSHGSIAPDLFSAVVRPARSDASNCQ